jgi:hypothetical protein
VAFQLPLPRAPFYPYSSRRQRLFVGTTQAAAKDGDERASPTPSNKADFLAPGRLEEGEKGDPTREMAATTMDHHVDPFGGGVGAGETRRIGG